MFLVFVSLFVEGSLLVFFKFFNFFLIFKDHASIQPHVILLFLKYAFLKAWKILQLVGKVLTWVVKVP